jgi:hypothetical protein
MRKVPSITLMIFFFSSILWAGSSRSDDPNRPSGLRCSTLHFVDSNAHPLAFKKIVFAKEHVETDRQHPSKLLVQYTEILKRVTDRYGNLILPSLTSGNYMLQIIEPGRSVTGIVRVLDRWPAQACSQDFIVEGSAQSYRVHALR